ncbi:unnamed protein product [Adineta ricciae]|uniref:MSP domain-containing protein n=1 Tax=Adineta ricciae TaxID=249248 RepID=A0A815B9H2_ADIRI|nr:unnamed protein product [Adineta ricciae]
MTLELIPNGDLIFKGPFTAVSTTTLKLSNSGNERLAYKIKTTAPKRYCVKPNSGFLDANATANIQVMLQPQPAGQSDDRSKHKFMVQWVAVPNSYSDDVENFWKQDLKSLNVQDSKLKCVFAEDQSAAVVPNDSTDHRGSETTDSAHVVDSRTQQTASSASISNQRSSPITSRATNSIQSQSQDRQQDASDDLNKSRPRQQDIERLKSENDLLKEKLKQAEGGLRQRTTGGNSAVDRSKSSQHQNGLVLFGIALTEQLVLVAFVIALLFGFSLGYFFFSCSN